MLHFIIPFIAIAVIGYTSFYLIAITVIGYASFCCFCRVSRSLIPRLFGLYSRLFKLEGVDKSHYYRIAVEEFTWKRRIPGRSALYRITA